MSPVTSDLLRRCQDADKLMKGLRSRCFRCFSGTYYLIQATPAETALVMRQSTLAAFLFRIKGNKKHRVTVAKLILHYHHVTMTPHSANLALLAFHSKDCAVSSHDKLKRIKLSSSLCDAGKEIHMFT